MPYQDPDDQAEYQRLWILRRRQAYLADKSCIVCGSTKNLEIDHIDKSTKTKSIGEVWSMSPNNPIRLAELAKCQILCVEHHREKTNFELSGPREFCRSGQHRLIGDNVYTHTKNGKLVRECRACKRDRRRINYILSGK